MNWKIGQKLVCIDDADYLIPSIAPKKDEVVTLRAHTDEGWIQLSEYPFYLGQIQEFRIGRFRPLVGNPAKSELINSFKEVTETSDCPINVPEKETV